MNALHLLALCNADAGKVEHNLRATPEPCYACDKTLNEIVLMQSNESLMSIGKVWVPTQFKSLSDQYKYGIRSFDLSLYEPSEACTDFFTPAQIQTMKLFTKHDKYQCGDKSADHWDDVTKVITKMEKVAEDALNISNLPDPKEIVDVMKGAYEEAKSLAKGDFAVSIGYDPTEAIETLVKDIEKNEIVVITSNNDLKKDGDALKHLMSIFGDKLIKNYDSCTPFKTYFESGQQILFLTYNNDIVDSSSGIHAVSDYFGVTDPNWSSIKDYAPSNLTIPLPKKDCSGLIMNHTPLHIDNDDYEQFLGPALAGTANYPSRIASHARNVHDADWNSNRIYPNIVSLDYASLMNPVKELANFQKGDWNDGCWGPGKVCGWEIDCHLCCHPAKEAFWFIYKCGDGK